MAKDWSYIRVSPDMKAKVDNVDLKRVEKYSWRAIETSTGKITVLTNIIIKGKKTSVTLGKFIMKPGKKKMMVPLKLIR